MRYHLLIDCDDTLWENNIFFERAIEAFIEFLNHSSLAPQEVRVVLYEVERTQGYGTASFVRSLEETFRRLAERPVQDEDIARIEEFGSQVRQHPMQIMDGVRETLEYLAPRHDLIMLTKGEEEEQRIKIENSGLALFFQHTIVVPEKDARTYTRLVRDLELESSNTWMVGNSPRSDINPAMLAGLNAVFIPHPHTWQVEHEELRIEGEGRFLQLATFSELREYF